jgi:hypothetical protein
MSVDKTNTIKRCLPYLPFYYVNVLLNEKFTKPIYNCLNNNDIIPNSLSKWKAFGVTDICLQDIFKVCFKTTVDTSVQWLQYRILHRLLPVSYYL